ncbi:MAG: phospho-sugar mutase [Desulfitobacteriaceae bacterium]|nr:phospho-sugar mutase [Desulfitobacteriaceae bacterium]MDI6879364.1 phospho-sugar mutase [Desulfitobacteriaceae bacterium]MDI6913987.1 phospho-sugar mutase [Desulfitobacteriaceae bacterium]
MIQERYLLWSTHPYFDEATREELRNIAGNPTEIDDRFYRDLEFGTGGMRGIMGAGTNRMNRYVIRKATQGLSEYLKENVQDAATRGVAIAYDSRRHSTEFAREAALVLAGNGIKAYVFESLRPTPELSFTVRHLGCVAGIVVTASHNSKEYNGYKVYDEDGGQSPPRQADAILAKIEARENWLDIELMEEKEAIRRGFLVYIGQNIDEVYLRQVRMLALHPELIREQGGELGIVYTPLHGAGNQMVQRMLRENGFSQLFVVPEQEDPDPEFSTVEYPNPENPAALALAWKYGEARNADLLVATDPDGDRLGIVARKTLDGPFAQLSGNQAGIILAYYLLSQKKQLGILPEKAVLIKTIASTDLADEVGKAFGVRVESVLTGFKFIAEKEKEMEDAGTGIFQMGFEESYGYLAGDFVRDKDGVIAALLFAEAALHYKIAERRTLWQVLEEISIRFGYYHDGQESFEFPGKEGQEEMEQIMEILRKTEITEIGGLTVEHQDDYELRHGKNRLTGEDYPLTLPKSNVLRFSFLGGGFVMARPSGTEPKIKFYFSVKGTGSELEETFAQVKRAWLERIQNILAKIRGQG